MSIKELLSVVVVVFEQPVKLSVTVTSIFIGSLIVGMRLRSKTFVVTAPTGAGKSLTKKS